MTVLSRLTADLADRYRLERELGQGGMATVYLARDIKHAPRVALKVLKPELVDSSGQQPQRVMSVQVGLDRRSRRRVNSLSRTWGAAIPFAHLTSQQMARVFSSPLAHRLARCPVSRG